MTKVCKVCKVELTPENRYGTSLLCLKHGKEYMKEWWNTHPERRYYKTHPEKSRERSRKYQKDNPKNAAFRARKWQKAHPLAYKILRDRGSSKRRSLGYIPINKPFKRSEGHHFTWKFVIHIPMELNGIDHSQNDFDKMKIVNNRIRDWLNEPGNPHSNPLLISTFVDLCEEEYGMDYFDGSNTNEQIIWDEERKGSVKIEKEMIEISEFDIVIKTHGGQISKVSCTAGG